MEVVGEWRVTRVEEEEGEGCGERMDGACDSVGWWSGG